MKRVGLIVFLLSLVITSKCFAAPCFIINGGGGGSADAGSIGFEIGGTQAIQNKMPLIFEFSAAFTDDMPNGILDYSVPHSDYTRIGDRNKGNEYGFLLKTGWNIQNLSILIGAGFSYQELANVAQSNVTGWYYTQSKETKYYAEGYGGLLYTLERLIFTIGYNNRRGIVGGVGIIW